ncbi:RNA-directed DNA polymerase from mobile element jockey, partial [Aphis craccivora]
LTLQLVPIDRLSCDYFTIFDLCFFFQYSLDSGIYSDLFKLIFVTLTFKSGDTSDRKNNKGFAPVIQLQHTTLRTLKETKQVDVIYTDFRKAYDRTNHKTIMKILVSSEFGESLLSWFCRIYDQHKVYYTVLYGVP